MCHPNIPVYCFIQSILTINTGELLFLLQYQIPIVSPPVICAPAWLHRVVTQRQVGRVVSDVGTMLTGIRPENGVHSGVQDVEQVYINTLLATYSTSSNAYNGQQHSDRLLDHWNWCICMKIVNKKTICINALFFHYFVVCIYNNISSTAYMII